MKYAHVSVPAKDYVFAYNTYPTQVDWLVSNLRHKYNEKEIAITYSNVELTKEQVLQHC